MERGVRSADRTIDAEDDLGGPPENPPREGQGEDEKG